MPLYSWTQSRPYIDLILRASPAEPFSWNQREGWASVLIDLGLLNQIYWIWANEADITYLFQSLRQSSADLVLIMSGDDHQYCLHDTDEKKNFWRELKIPVVCHCCERIFNSPFPFSEQRSRSAVETFDAFLYTDELSASLFEQSSKPSLWIPQYVDESLYKSSIPFEKRRRQIFFRGQTTNFGFEGAYEQRRNLIERVKNHPFFSISEAYKPLLTPAQAAQMKADYCFTLNAPANCAGYSSALYEAMACGCVTFQYELPALEKRSLELFKPGCHFLLYNPNDIDGFIAEAENVVKNWQDYKQIAEQGREECLAKHTIKKRMVGILNFLETNWSKLSKQSDRTSVFPGKTNDFAVFKCQGQTAIGSEKTTLRETFVKVPKARQNTAISSRANHNSDAINVNRPRFSVGMSVLNAEIFLQTCLESIYDFAHEILIVEGACPQARWDANSQGTSRDRTLEIIRAFPDPDNKIKLIASQACDQEGHMVNAYIPYVTGDYLFRVDSDEIWTNAALENIRRILIAYPDITCLEFNPLHFWHNFETVLVGAQWEEPFIRIFRFEKGARWQSHEPPILLNPQGRAYNSLKKINLTDKYGITFFHYSYVTEQQARWKCEFFKRAYDITNLPSSDESTRIGMTCDWFEKVWLAWKDDPRGVEKKYGTIPGGGPAWGPKGRTEPYYGPHPYAISHHPLWTKQNLMKV